MAPGSRSGRFLAIRIEAASQRPSSPPSIARCGGPICLTASRILQGSFSAAHYHPQFTRNEPSARFWDAALSSDPWTWLGDQITSLGTAAGGAGWPLDPGDATELPGLASAVVAAAQQFAPAECRSAAECFQLTRDVHDAVQLMIATLRAPERLDRNRAAPWLAHS